MPLVVTSKNAKKAPAIMPLAKPTAGPYQALFLDAVTILIVSCTNIMYATTIANTPNIPQSA